MVKEHEREKPARCELGSELILAYSGLFLECLPPINSDVTGYVLTYSGKLYYRKQKNQPWLYQTAPSAYIFRDCACQRLYEVNSCKKAIKPIKFEGRLLDLSTNTLYEVNKCGEWIELAELDQPSSAAATQEIQVSGAQTVAVIDVLAGLKNVKYLPALSSADAFLDVSVDNVANQITATLVNAQTPPVDGPAVSLVYKGWLVSGLPANKWAKQSSCNQVTKKKVYVTVLIERVNPARLSAVGSSEADTSQVSVVITAPSVDEAAAIAAANLLLPLAGPTRGLADIGEWAAVAAPRYVEGITFDAATGLATALAAGDYSIDAVLGYRNTTDPELPGPAQPPYFLLWLQRAGTPTPAPVVLAAAPVDAAYELPAGDPQLYRLAAFGQAVLHADVTLQVGDSVYLQYYDNTTVIANPTTIIFNNNFLLAGATSQFTIEALGAPSN